MDQPDFLSKVQEGYDRTAHLYAERFHHHLDDKPIDLAMLSAFAGLVQQSGNRRVLDIGCGTGATTALLDDCGVDVAGVDLSPNMIAQARELNPGLEFRVGSMTSLEAADRSIGGICAWYSIIHIPDHHLDDVFVEFHRALAPHGLILLAFQVGDEPRILTNAFGQEVHLTFFRHQPQKVAELLSSNGFQVYAELVRQPDDDGLESTPHAYLIARKSS